MRKVAIPVARGICRYPPSPSNPRRPRQPRWCAKASPRNSPTTSGRYRMVGASLVPNVGIVVGKKAVLVIDTGMGTRNAETVLREVAKVGAGKPIYIVTTHVHPEHDMGAHAFPKDSKLIRSKDQVEDIAAGAGMNLVPVFAQRSALNVELLARRAAPRRRHHLRPGIHARSRRRQGEDLRHGHQPHAWRYRGARRRRVVLGRRGHAPAAFIRQPHREDQPLA